MAALVATSSLGLLPSPKFAARSARRSTAAPSHRGGLRISAGGQLEGSTEPVGMCWRAGRGRERRVTSMPKFPLPHTEANTPTAPYKKLEALTCDLSAFPSCCFFRVEVDWAGHRSAAA